MVDEQALEGELFAIGSRLAKAMPVQRNPLKAIDDKAMDLAAQDAELKAALFRFVDVVPACGTWRTASSSARTRRRRSACCASCGRTAWRRRSTCSARPP